MLVALHINPAFSMVAVIGGMLEGWCVANRLGIHMQNTASATSDAGRTCDSTNPYSPPTTVAQIDARKSGEQ